MSKNRKKQLLSRFLCMCVFFAGFIHGLPIVLNNIEPISVFDWLSLFPVYIVFLGTLFCAVSIIYGFTVWAFIEDDSKSLLEFFKSHF